MKFGLCIPHYGKSLPIGELRTTLENAEAMGFDSVWVSDHVVTPEHMQASVGPIFYDPFVVLTYAAALTRRVKLGSTVIVVPYRNPLVVAKMVASLDALSEGRVILGVGAGGAPDEFDALGVPSHQRGKRTDEYLRLMVALWTQDPTDFQGRFFSFTGVRFGPKPIQKPHPPFWVGGRSDAALRRAVAFGEAWHPTSMALPALEERMARLRELSQQAGRERAPTVTVHQGIRLDAGQANSEDRRPGRGTTQQLRDDMDRYRNMGITTVVCRFSAGDFNELWRDMESFAANVIPYFPEPGSA